jgi:hypothetical protein
MLVPNTEEAIEWLVYQPTARNTGYYKGRWVEATADEADLNGLILCKHRTGRHHAIARLAKQDGTIAFRRRADLTAAELAEACMLRDRERKILTVLKLTRNGELWEFKPRFRLPDFIRRYLCVFACDIYGDFGEPMSFRFTDQRLSSLEDLVSEFPITFRRQ